MQRNYFHSDEIKFEDSVFVVEFSEEKKLTEQIEKDNKVSEDEEEYNGPTAQALREEAEAFKMQWDQEKQNMIDDARKEALEIIDSAKEEAKLLVDSAKEEASSIKEESALWQEERKKEAEEKYNTILGEANEKLSIISKEAEDNGFSKGEKTGFESGLEEANRLISRLHDIINKTIKKRADIISETEGQMIDLVLGISNKVIKVISSSNREVIIENTLSALDKLKSKSNVIIRASFEDIKVLRENKQVLIDNIEKLDNVDFLEDTSIEDGGCIVETDFGEVDARISTQLMEIERKIMEASPVKSKGSSFRLK